MRIHFILAVLAATMVATVAARVVFSLYALELGASAFQVGLLSAANNVPALLLAIVAGILSDRFGARWLLCGAALCGAAGLILARFAPGLPALFFGAALLGVWSVVTIVLSQTLVGLLSGPNQLARTYGNFALAMSFASFAGPLLGGYLVDHVGHGGACLRLVGFALVVTTLLGLAGGMLPPGSGPAHDRLSDTLSDRGFWRVMWLNTVVQLAIDMYPFYLPIYGHAMGLSGSAIGSTLAIASLATFIVRFGLTRLIGRFGEERMLAWSVGISALGFALTPLAPSATWMMAVAFLYGLGTAGGAPITAMLMMKRSGKGRAGASMGLRMTGNAAVRIVAPPLLGGLAAAAGLLSVFIAAGVFLGGAAIAIGRSARGRGSASGRGSDR